MKKTLLLIILLITISIGYAQKKEKIKGDKEVTTINKDLFEKFNEIILSDNIEVSLKQGNENSYLLTADQNLIDVIQIKAIDSVLKIYTTQKIVSKKKLELILTVEKIDKLTLKDDTSFKSSNRIETDTLEINSYGSSKFKIDLNVGSLSLNMYDKSGGKLLTKSIESIFNMNDRTDLKGDVVTDSLKVNLNGRSKFKITGETEHAVFNLKGAASLRAEDMKASTAKLFTSNKSDVHVNATKNLELYAKGNSNVYIYGNPAVDVQGLTEKSKIIKK